jgi:hypothetical protein
MTNVQTIRQGGHTFKCGHVKYCSDHVQMVEENRFCNLCKVIKTAGNEADRLMLMKTVKKIADTLLKTSIVKVDQIW